MPELLIRPALKDEFTYTFFHEIREPLVGYKKVQLKERTSYYNHVITGILKLVIPAGAVVFCGDRGKCRTDVAIPISLQAIYKYYKPGSNEKIYRFYTIPEKRLINSGVVIKPLDAFYGASEKFVYRLNVPAFPAKQYSRIRRTCDSGVHFFLTKTKAIHFGTVYFHDEVYSFLKQLRN